MTKAQAVERLARVRELVPGVAVRTTFMVGFPGETEREFEELLEFVREARFEHLGAFAYSREKGTPAARLEGQIPHRVKKERLHRLMALQQEIVREANERMLGRRTEVMVDERLEEGTFAFRGRTAGDAPEVDGTVYLSGNGVAPGDIVPVLVTGMMEYDLAGEIVAG
jgi:ribosomal protein S12 methylthiotransferase